MNQENDEGINQLLSKHALIYYFLLSYIIRYFVFFQRIRGNFKKQN